MAGGNSTNVTFEIDITSGGALTDVTAGLDKIGDFAIKNGVIVNTPYGTGAVRKRFTGMVEADQFTVEGEIETTAGGAYMILRGARADKTLRTIKMTYLAGEYVTCEALVVDLKRVAVVGANNRFLATLAPTDTITES